MAQRTGASGRVLIVDDEPRQRFVLSAMLTDGGFEIQFAGDGQEALERLTTFNADVIVADLVMPRMDGFELLRHLGPRRPNARDRPHRLRQHGESAFRRS